MPISLKNALDFVSDAIGKIMVVAGFLLLIVAVALFSTVYQWSSLASFMLGVFLIVVGAVLNYESPKIKVPSREGWGTILVCVSTMLMASAVVVVLFAVPGQVWELPASVGRRRLPPILLIDLNRPNAWIAPILAWAGIGLFGFGVFLKFSRDILC